MSHAHQSHGSTPRGPSKGLSLGQFVTGLADGDADATARRHVVDAIIDCIGCALAARNEDLLAPLLAVYRTTTARDADHAVPVLGTGRWAAPADSAVLNGALGHALDYDDISHPAYSHPTVGLLPALLACTTPATRGSDLVTAYIAGLQVYGQLGRALNLAHYEQGWHPTGTFGSIATAVAAARLFGLDANQVETAASIGASSSAGVRMNFGTMTKPLHAGNAARNGVLAAQLARAGFTATHDPFTHKYGFARVFTGAAANTDLLRHWGDELEIETEYGLCLKPFPACAATHTAIEATLTIREELGGDIARIARMVVGASKLAFLALIYPDPVTPLQCKFSMQYCVARALLSGEIVMSSFDPALAAEPALRAWLPRVLMEDDPRVRDHPEMGAVVRAELKDGTHIERTVLIAAGKPERWFDRERLWSKFVDCTRTGGLDDGWSRRVFDALQDLDRAAPVGAVIELLARPQAA